MRWKGRVLALAVAMVLLLGTVPVFATDGNGAVLGQSGGLINPAGIIDTTPPVLTSISINKTVVEAPETVTVTAEAWDDISGVDRAYLTFVCDEWESRLNIWIYDAYDAPNVLTGDLNIDNWQLPGEYSLESVWLFDKADNQQNYAKNPTDYQLDDGYLPLWFSVSFNVDNTNIDTTPPTLISVSSDKSQVECPGEFTLSANAIDDNSGIDRMYVTFTCYETDASINEWVYGDGLLVKTISVDEYQIPGIYALSSIWLFDAAGNQQNYYDSLTEYQISKGYKLLPSTVSVEIKNDFLDLIPPELTGITLDKYEVEAPGSVLINASSSDNMSGTARLYLTFKCAENNKQLNAWIYANDNNGSLSGVLDIGVYQLPGLYELDSAWIYDNAGNVARYQKNPDEWQLVNGYLSLSFDLEFTVINDGTYDLATNTNNPNLADEIAALPDGSTVGIDYSSNPHIGADVFEAIQGKDIDVVLVGDGIEWAFNGLDIDNPKDLDLSVSIEPIDYFWNGNAAEIKKELQDTPAVVLSFKPNGDLPGKATIRVKADSEFRDYLGVDDLYVYYFNPEKNSLELVKANVNVASDGFIEFEITHNSEFVIAAGKAGGGNVGGTEPPTEPVDPPVNPPVDPTDPTEPGGGTTPPINPTYPFGGSNRSSRSSSGRSSKTYNFDKRDVAASAKVNGNEIEVTGQTQLGFYQATYMGTKIEGVTTRATDNGVIVILPREFIDSIQNKQWKKVRIEFFNAYVDVDYSK